MMVLVENPKEYLTGIEGAFNRGFELKWVKEAIGQRQLSDFIYKLRKRKSME